ncbi:hypothetical protein [Actinokineospora enzanensis]|uniref:hypothetical protein n=1 Tax=Actinokineospora enzanensis TaxID=155975 RepID=UPI000476A73E|nr:hypothetical protein [Actinokineospora enzanensis]
MACPDLVADLGLTPAEVDRGITALCLLRLLTPDASGGLVPTSPDVAAAELVGPMRLEVVELERRASTLQAQLSSLGPLYSRSRHREDVERVEGEDRVRALIADEARRCVVEIRTSHPGRTAACWLPTDLDCRVRSLYQHPVRVDIRSRAVLEAFVDAGREIRTCAQLSGRVAVFDQATAVVAGGSGTAVLLRDPSTVDYIGRGLEQRWATAVPYEAGGTAPRYGAAGEDFKRAILRFWPPGPRTSRSRDG